MATLDPGLRFIVEPSSTRLSAEERELLAELKPSGVMLRRRNFCQDLSYEAWCSVYQELLADVRAAIGRQNLFVSIDHEGGRVHRFPPPITRFPYPAFYASSLPSIEAVAAAMALELKSLGVNLSFAPVADIHSNPLNPVINQRAFGRTADEVCARVVPFAQTLLREGVLACAKHFPGHGDTASDSHHALPVITRSEEELRGNEFKPFAALIEDGIPMVMSAHILVPAIDKNNQATLSPQILHQILREELGFSGVTVADALGMEGIRSDATSSSFVRRAQEARLDLFLFAGDSVSIKDAVKCRDELMDLVRGDPRMTSLASESERRIESLLSQTLQYKVDLLPEELLTKHATLAQQLAAHQEWEDFVLELPGFE